MAQLDFIYQPIKITAGSNESSLAKIKGNTLIGFIFPIGFEGATVTIKGRLGRDFSTGGTTGPYSVVDPTTGNAITVYTGGTGGTMVPITAADLSCLQYFTLVSDTAVAADREIIVIARPTA